jgi:hypothetical protein
MQLVADFGATNVMLLHLPEREEIEAKAYYVSVMICSEVGIVWRD